MDGPLQLDDYVHGSYMRLAAHAKLLIPKRLRTILDEDDVAQESILHVLMKWRHFSELDPNARRAYSRMTVRRIVLNQIRRTQTEDHVQETAARDAMARSVNGRPTRDEFTTKVLGWLELLPSGQHDALHAVYVDGLKRRAAAGRLSISLSALDQRLHKGIESLRRGLHAMDDHRFAEVDDIQGK